MRHGNLLGLDLPRAGRATRAVVQYHNIHDAAVSYTAQVMQSPWTSNLLDLGNHGILFDPTTLVAESSFALINSYHEMHHDSDRAADFHENAAVDHRQDIGMEHKARDDPDDAQQQQGSLSDSPHDMSIADAQTTANTLDASGMNDAPLAAHETSTMDTPPALKTEPADTVRDSGATDDTSSPTLAPYFLNYLILPLKYNSSMRQYAFLF